MRAQSCFAGARLAALLAVLLIGLESAALAADAALGGTFDGLSGLWSGNGTITYASGTKERLSCRVQYVLANPDKLHQTLKCAAASYDFQINAIFDNANGNISGVWSEVVHNVSGTLTGTAKTGRIVGNLSGPGFIAQVVVITRGNVQQVTIEAALQDIRSVAVDLRKTSR